MRKTCLACPGLLTSLRVSIKAPSRSGFSAMWSLIIAPALVLPTLSQFPGLEFQVCLTNILSQCIAAIAKSGSSTIIKKDSGKSQWYNMRTGIPVGQECAVQKVKSLVPKQRSAENVAEMNDFKVAFHRENRGAVIIGVGGEATP